MQQVMGTRKRVLAQYIFFGDFLIISGRLCGGGRIKMTI